MSTKVICKDCIQDGVMTNRPAPWPGPRCATHHHRFKKLRSESAHDAMVARVYQMKRGDYDKLYRLQGGLCAICRRATGASKRLSVDHDHKTNQVRGLLCGPCNQLLGHCRDNPEMLCRAIRYLNRPPAALLHVVDLD